MFGAERGAAGSAEPKLITKPTSEKKRRSEAGLHGSGTET